MKALKILAGLAAALTLVGVISVAAGGGEEATSKPEPKTVTVVKQTPKPKAEKPKAEKPAPKPEPKPEPAPESASEAVDQLKEAITGEKEPKKDDDAAIKNLKKVYEGMPRAEVIQVMGKPETTDVWNDSYFGKTETMSWDAWLDGHFVTIELVDGVVESFSSQKIN